ncbi:hypothetical protein HYALB_00003430 [Hymenoscyphus albidus]|uniref:Uncharacterized protein n=1 Tax=Hymenoscyphus albidus TaxID=595503 RepID=A0A9N9LCI3_9HELO|nr:hypothetical protein HYALB_00003430 [Hymenoscyphus albidus]
MNCEATEVFYRQNTFFSEPNDWIQMKYEATEVSYDQNTFLSALNDSDPTGREVQHFFESRSKAALDNLKSIKIIAADFFDASEQALNQIWEEWVGAFELYAKRATNENLEVLVHFQKSQPLKGFWYKHIDAVPPNAWSLEPFRESMEQAVMNLNRLDGVRKIGVEIDWELPYFDEDKFDPNDPIVEKFRAHKKDDRWGAEVARITKHLKETILGNKYTDKVVKVDDHRGCVDPFYMAQL